MMMVLKCLQNLTGLFPVEHVKEREYQTNVPMLRGNYLVNIFIIYLFREPEHFQSISSNARLAKILNINKGAFNREMLYVFHSPINQYCLLYLNMNEWWVVGEINLI
jgi:hypothetical protein